MRDIDLTKEKDNCDRYKSGYSEIDGNGIAMMMKEMREGQTWEDGSCVCTEDLC